MTTIRRRSLLFAWGLAIASLLAAQMPPPKNLTRVRAGSQATDILHQGPPAPPPDAPAGLQVTDHTATQVTLTWSAAPDTPHHVIDHYDIYLNGVKVSTTTELSKTVSYDPAGPYLQFFSVVAVDDAGNRSVASEETLATPPTVAPFFDFQAKFASTPRRQKEGFTDPTGRTYHATAYSHRRVSDEYTEEGVHIGHKEDDLSISESYDLATHSWSRTVTGVADGWRSQNYFDLIAGSFHSVWQLAGDRATLVGDYAGSVTLPSVITPSIAGSNGTITSGLVARTDAYGGQFTLGKLVATGTASLSYTSEYTDAMLMANVRADHTIANEAAAGADWPELGWNFGAVADQGVLIAAGPVQISDGGPTYFAHLTGEKDGFGNLVAASIGSCTYRLHSPARGPVQLRWLEVFHPFHDGPGGRITDGPDQTTLRQETVTGGTNGAWTSAYQLAPPSVFGGIEILPLGGTIRLQTPSLTPTAGVPRLFLKDAIFAGEAVPIELLGIDPSNITAGVVQISGDAGSVKLVQVDPEVVASEGLAAAVAQGIDIPSGSDLWADTEQSLLSGWIVAVGGAPGTGILTLKLTTLGVTYDVVKTIPVYPRFDLAVDADRDGTIKLASEDDTERTSADMPYRFWINDDDDDGDDKRSSADDIPLLEGSRNRDSSDNKVDGIRDLEDFFPVYLDIKQLLTVLPPGMNGISYYLKHEDSALGVVFTSYSRAQAFEYLRGAPAGLDSGFGPALTQAAGEAAVTKVTAAGVDIYTTSTAFVDRIRNNDGGVLLVEACRVTNQPLVLEVRKGSTVIAELKLQLKIDPVETMFHYYNMRSYAHGAAIAPNNQGPGYNSGAPTDAPNDPFVARSDRKNLVFVHGYNVNSEAARGSAATVFKRFYWSGSKARYYAVLWRGDDGQGQASRRLLGLVVPNSATPDYHRNVGHAWQQGPLFRDFLGTLQGDTAIMAHSLGNVVTQVALTRARDPNYAARLVSTSKPGTVKHYFAVDAAVPLEATSASEITSESKSRLRHSWWAEYDTLERLWPTYWHALFKGTGDAREGLTWQNVFTNLDVGTNFYSSGEEVLANPLDDEMPFWEPLFFAGRRAWVAQEKLKGGNGAAAPFFRSWTAGWVENKEWYLPIVPTPPFGAPQKRRRFASEAQDVAAPNGVPTSALASEPFFQRFQASESGSFYPGYQGSRLHAPVGDPNADDEARKLVTIAKCLGEAIPALSYAQGSNPANAFNRSGMGGNFDLDEPYDSNTGLGFKNGWPASRSSQRWFHSDCLDVAYIFNFRFYDRMKNDGGLQ